MVQIIDSSKLFLETYNPVNGDILVFNNRRYGIINHNEETRYVLLEDNFGDLFIPDTITKLIDNPFQHYDCFKCKITFELKYNHPWIIETYGEKFTSTFYEYLYVI